MAERDITGPPAPASGSPHGGFLLAVAVVAGVATRAIGAVAAELFARQQQVLDLFGDSAIYWQLAEALRTGQPFRVLQWGVPHDALRTPGYPAFLAICQFLFGPANTLAPRLAQAVLGGVAVLAAFGLVAAVCRPRSDEPRRSAFVPLVAALLVAVEPYTVGLSALLLSEGLFFPLMLLGLWGLALLWRRRDDEPGPAGTLAGLRLLGLALATGAILGAAVLVRPSWALFLPLVLIAWPAFERSRRSVAGAILVGLGIVVVMGPWWGRNAQKFDRFVPTALWVGASLYDGVGPQATGASDMRFLELPEFRDLSETDQDAAFLRLSRRSIQADPGRVLRLALVKAGRFWSPWPNADEFSSPGLAWLSALATLPIFALLAVGLWDRRRDPRALVLLAGPLLTFFLLHLLFVSSIRYRVPGLLPAFGLVAIGLARLLGKDPLGRRLLDPTTETRRPGLRRAIGWMIALPPAILAGGGWYAYTYATNSQNLSQVIEQEGRRFLPTSVVSIRRGTIRPFLGELTLSQIRVDQHLAELGDPTVDVGWLQVRFDLWALLRGERRVNQLVVAQPTLRLCRRADGRWNLEGLLADPWPAPPLDSLPHIQIEKGTVLLVEPDGSTAVLRDVSAKFEPVAEVSQTLRFQVTGQGDNFEQVRLAGTFHLPSKRVEIDGGDLLGLQISSALERRLPAQYRPAFQRLGLSAGVADLHLGPCFLVADEGIPRRYEISARLHSGTWAPSGLPFGLSDVELAARLDERTIRIDRLSGTNGRTTVQAAGTLSASDPAGGPMAVNLDVTNLELDDRLRAHTPAAHLDLWEQFQPRGRVDVYARVVRTESGSAPAMGVTVDLQDVALKARDWAYPLEHVRGRLNWEKGAIEIERMSTLIGNRPASCSGKVLDPGPNARVELDFEFGALPVDDTLMASLPPNMVKVIRQFRPTGTISVREGKMIRRPPATPGAEPQVDLTATLDLGAPFGFTWEGLPYPVTDVSGQLVVGPGRWELRDIKGWNGLASVEGDGWVRLAGTGPDRFDAELHLRAHDLPFNEQLKRALPPEWRTTWEILKPSGATDIDARINIRDNVQDHRIAIVPDRDSKIALGFQPVATTPGAPAPRPFALPAMLLDRGTFIYEDGVVGMSEVAFRFRDSQVEFQSGSVDLENNGQFELAVDELRVTNFQIDRELRKIMPPTMADFARRFDENTIIPTLLGNLRLGWSGRSGEPAWVSWDRGLIVLTGQTINAGVPLQSIQGRLAEVSGRFNGQDLEVSGLLDLDSIHVLGQQVTNVKTPLIVAGNTARLDAIEGRLLEGTLTGKVEVGLASTPAYAVTLAVEDADLAEFAMTLQGRQAMGGLLSGQLALNGLGTDLRTAMGRGDFKIRDGDLGELPAALRLFKFLNPDVKPPTKTAFDSAEVTVVVREGLAQLDPIELTGDAISLRGAGTMDFQGDLDLRLRVLYGRSRFDIPLLSAAMSGASGEIMDLHVTGPASFPRFRSQVLPRVSSLLGSFGSRAFRPRPAAAEIPSPSTPLGARFGLSSRPRDRPAAAGPLPPLPPQ